MLGLCGAFRVNKLKITEGKAKACCQFNAKLVTGAVENDMKYTKRNEIQHTRDVQYVRK